MVRKTGISSDLRIAITLLCFVALAQASENVLILPLAGDIPPTTNLPHSHSSTSEWQVTLVVMPELASSLSCFTQAYEAQSPIEQHQLLTTDCSLLTNQLPENGYYLYATLGRNEHSAIDFYKCINSESALLGVLLVDAEKLKDGYPIDSLAYENLKNLKSGSSSIVQNLCEIGNFDPKFSKCLNHNKFQRSAIIDNYNSLVPSLGIASAIIEALSDTTGLTLSDFTTMKAGLDTLIACDASSCTGEACITASFSQLFLQAAISMLIAAKVIFADVTITVANEIKDKVGCVQFATDIKNFAISDMCLVNYAIYSYFDFYITKFGIASDEYKTAQKAGSVTLDKIWISHISGSEGSFVVSGGEVYVFKNEECLGTYSTANKNIITVITIRYGGSGDLPGPSCDYQLDTDIIAMMEYKNQRFGPNSDGYYWSLYKIGAIDANDLLNVYLDSPIQVTNAGCTDTSFAKSVSLNYYYESTNKWEVFSLDNDQLAASLIYNEALTPKTATLVLKYFGQFLIKPICGDKALDLFAATCGCHRSCSTCKSLTTCTVCADGYSDTDGTLDNNLCVCNTGTYDNGSICVDCPSNCATCTSATECQTCTTIKYLIDGTIKPDKKCYEAKQYFQNSCLISLNFDNFGYLILESKCQFPLFKSTISGSEGDDCSNYLSSLVSLGTDPKCTLRTPYIIQVILGSASTIGTASDPKDLEPKSELVMETGDYSLWETWKIVLTTPALASQVSISGYSNIDIDCLTIADISGHPVLTSKVYGVYRSIFNFLWTADTAVTFTDTNAENIGILLTSLPVETTFEVTLTIMDPMLVIAIKATKVITTTSSSFMFSLSTGSSARYYKSTAFSVYPVNINKCSVTGTMTYLWAIDQGVTELTLTNQILNIPRGKLSSGDYNIQLTITIGAVSVTEKTVVKILDSDIVIILDKGYIITTPSTDDISISAAKSYDPDSTAALIYSWTSWPAAVIGAQSGSSVTILKGNYPVLTDYTSFTVLLTVSFESKSSRTYITVKVGTYLTSPTLASTTPIKIKAVNYLTLQAKYSNTLNAAWSLESGPYIVKSSTTPYLTFLPSTLLQRESYSFKIAFTVSESVGSMWCFFRTNGLPSCSATVILNPTSGTSLSTGFNFMLPGCVDSDNEDLPLSYKISGLKAVCCPTLLTSAREDPNIFNFKISKTYKKIEYTVSDALGDSIKKSSIDITINTRLRQLKESEDLINIYYDLIISQEVVPVIVMMLDEYTIPEELLDIMWSDLKKNIGNFTGQDYSEVVSSVIISFLDTNQNPVFIQKRLVEYISFLEDALSSTEHYDEILNERVVQIAERTMLLQPEITDVVQAKGILQKLFNIQSILGTDGVSVNTARISTYEVENFNDMLSASPIILGLNTITVGDLEVDKSDIIRIEAMSFAFGLFSSIVDIEIKTLKSNDNGEIIDHDVVYIEVPDDELIIVMKYYGITNVKCSSYKDGLWNGDDCSVKSAENGEAKVSIKRSCTFQLFDENPVYTSKVPLYLIFSLIIAMAIFMPFMIYLDKNIPYLKVPTAFSITIETKLEREEREEKAGLETERKHSESSSILQYHLLISMFNHDTTLLRSRKLLILLTNVVFALFIQVLLLKLTTVSNIAVGVISALIALVPSALCNALFREHGTTKLAAGAVIILLVNIASVIGCFLIQGTSGWLISWLVGLATELIVSQSIIMIGTKIIANYI